MRFRFAYHYFGQIPVPILDSVVNEWRIFRHLSRFVDQGWIGGGVMWFEALNCANVTRVGHDDLERNENATRSEDWRNSCRMVACLCWSSNAVSRFSSPTRIAAPCSSPPYLQRSNQISYLPCALSTVQLGWETWLLGCLGSNVQYQNNNNGLFYVHVRARRRFLEAKVKPSLASTVRCTY